MVINIIQIVVSVLLIISILLQMQGTGLSSSLGGGGGEFYRSKRSVEKLLIYATVVLSIIFAVLSIALLIPHK